MFQVKPHPDAESCNVTKCCAEDKSAGCCPPDQQCCDEQESCQEGKCEDKDPCCDKTSDCCTPEECCHPGNVYVCLNIFMS